MTSLRFLKPGASAAPMRAASMQDSSAETPATAPGPVPAALPARQRGIYLQWLTWSFTLFNTARLFCYLPTIWAIHVSGDSSQHSLWTWGTFLGANATMAAWLYEKDDRRVTRAMLVNVSNAAMCAATVTLILAARL